MLWNLRSLQLIGLVGLFENQHGTMVKIFVLMYTVNLQRRLLLVAMFLSIMRKQLCQLMVKKGSLQSKKNSIALRKIKHRILCLYLVENHLPRGKPNKFLTKNKKGWFNCTMKGTLYGKGNSQTVVKIN